jgi:hypothetical protein
MRPSTTISRRTGAWPAVLASAALAFGLLVMPGGAGAKRPGALDSGSARITVEQTDPHLGGIVTFDVEYPSQVKYPRVAVRCYGSDGSLLYAEAGSYDHAFLLGGAGSDWLRQGGPAHCTAELFYFANKGSQPQQPYSLAWSSFDAEG